MAAPEDGRDYPDPTRRTFLANERTYLAWWRTGLTALAAALAVGRIVPEVARTTRWPYEILGGAYALLGVVVIVYGAVRRKQVDRSLGEGSYAHPDDRLLAGVTWLAVLIGVATGALIVVNP
jgi:putative membrane protein